MTIVPTANRNFVSQKKWGQSAFQYFKNPQILMLCWPYTSGGGCLYLMEKVSWHLGVSIYEDIEFYRLLVLEIKDWEEQAVGMRK